MGRMESEETAGHAILINLNLGILEGKRLLYRENWAKKELFYP